MLYFDMPFAFFFLYFLIWVGAKSEAAPTYLYHNCTNTTTFTPNSVYKSNLNQLLSFLSSNSTHEFYNATAGQNPSTSVHGLFLCRGDVNATACRDCVTTATKDALEKYCAAGKQNIIWYDKCQLRYSNRYFFGTVDVWPRIALINTANITDVQFNGILNATMMVAAAEAANGGQKKFATKDTFVNEFQKVYCLVQCTQDLSAA